MFSSYFKSVQEKAEAQQILGLDFPTYRQAYSDRTAWVMSVLSELVYIKFNPLFGPANKNAPNEQSPEYIKQYFVDRITKMIDSQRAELLSTIIEQVAYDHDANKQALDEQLTEFNFKVVATFDRGGSQAILVDNDEYLVLAFRGTETDSLSDIKADTRANIRVCETKGMIHSGFYFAYQEIRKEIEETLVLPQFTNKKLYITGHSLGGALATIATKFTYHKGGLAACYTFGSPRVGNDDWINNIKTPIHRLVNAADCVTMLPPGDFTVTLLSTALKIVPGVGEKAAKYLETTFGGYMHTGNMRYLTNCQPGNYDDVKVLYSVSLFYRLKALVYKSLPFMNLLSDHSISVYCKKLMVIAFKRNKKHMENEPNTQVTPNNKAANQTVEKVKTNVEETEKVSPKTKKKATATKPVIPKAASTRKTATKKAAATTKRKPASTSKTATKPAPYDTTK